MLRRATLPLALVFALTLVAAACGDDDDDDVSAGTGGADTTAGPSDTTAAGGTGTTGGSGASAVCTPADGDLDTTGTLTVATGEPVFEPWMVDDDPTNGEGFESALVYELAGRLGFSADQVEWTRTGFDEAVAPGDKDYDFNIQQYGITPERDEVVDFSIGYYTIEQAVVAVSDSELAGATSVGELADFQLGAAIGTTSLDYIDEVIQPSSEALVFDDNAAAKAAFDAGQVDGLVFDLPTAYYITSVEIPDSSIVGVLPVVGDPEELGLLFPEGSPLVDCVDQGLQSMLADDTLPALQSEWLDQGGSIPTLSE